MHACIHTYNLIYIYVFCQYIYTTITYTSAEFVTSLYSAIVCVMVWMFVSVYVAPCSDIVCEYVCVCTSLSYKPYMCSG